MYELYSWVYGFRKKLASILVFKVEINQRKKCVLKIKLGLYLSQLKGDGNMKNQFTCSCLLSIDNNAFISQNLA